MHIGTLKKYGIRQYPPTPALRQYQTFSTFTVVPVHRLQDVKIKHMKRYVLYVLYSVQYYSNAFERYRYQLSPSSRYLCLWELNSPQSKGEIGNSKMGAANRTKGSCMVRKQTGRNAPAWLERRQDERPLPV